MYRQIPNLITIARLLLTALFFLLLNLHHPADFPLVMWIAFAVFIIACITDALDGYLARTWKVESAFGRVVDPFVDKILICGSFVFFASTQFLHPSELNEFTKAVPVDSITGVVPWMAVVLIAREFLVTGIRGLAESKGIDFRADWAGKIKMIAQCIAIGAILADLATSFGSPHIPWIHLTRDIMIWITLVVTTLSAIGYIARARRIIHD